MYSALALILPAYCTVLYCHFTSLHVVPHFTVSAGHFTLPTLLAHLTLPTLLPGTFFACNTLSTLLPTLVLVLPVLLLTSPPSVALFNCNTLPTLRPSLYCHFTGRLPVALGSSTLHSLCRHVRLAVVLFTPSVAMFDWNTLIHSPSYTTSLPLSPLHDFPVGRSRTWPEATYTTHR
jgi:hypothetical protein